MKYEMTGNEYEKSQGVRVSHKDQKIYFDASTYTKTTDRTESVDTARMFDEFNSYLETRPEAEQDQMWELCLRAHQILQTQTNVDMIESQLQRVVREIYTLLDLDDIRTWAVFKSSVRIPTNLLNAFQDTDTDEFRDRTYLRSHYIDLVAMAIALRPMVPIWGHYIDIIEGVTGSNYKEYMASRLLHDSKLFTTPTMKRLRTFVEVTLRNSKDNVNNAAAILAGMGTAEQPDWVRALVIVRRLAISKISAEDDTSHIITNVFQYVNSTIKSQDRKFGKFYGGRVSDKNDATSNKYGNDEQTVSQMEMYKMKQKVPDGDIAVLNVYVCDRHRAALRIDPTIDTQLVDSCYAAVQVLQQQEIMKHQSTLVQWTMSSVLPAPAGDSLNKTAILHAMAVTQAVLWHWQFYDLAALVTATAIPMNNAYGGYSFSGGRIPRGTMEQLQSIYKYYQAGRGAKGQSPRATNVGAKAVDKFCTLIFPYDWRLNCPAGLANKTNRIENSKKMVVPGDIREQLANLLIRIVTGSHNTSK